VLPPQRPLSFLLSNDSGFDFYPYRRNSLRNPERKKSSRVKSGRCVVTDFNHLANPSSGNIALRSSIVMKSREMRLCAMLLLAVRETS
jgi:hypothetical protein